jgi:N,N'-diacetyllegionaminate synthase
VRIGDWDLGERLLVMAEIGNNHEGDPEVARKLIERAAEAGAGAVKLQVFDARRFVRPSQRGRLEQLLRYQLPREEMEAICGLAHRLGLLVVATPLDTDTVEFVAPRVDALKIASGDNDCFPLIERVADAGLPMIISSGLAEVPELEAAIEATERRWSERGIEQELAVLHCVSAYPVSPEGADLGRIPQLAKALGRTIGYSDHTLGIDACVSAARLGARIIEKHLTLSHEFSDFRDHALSAEPAELAELVREAEAASAQRGTVQLPAPQKEARLAEEEPNREALRRSIVAAADLGSGRRLSEADLTWMRPRDGLSPGQESRLLGRPLRRGVKLGETIRPEDVEEA